MKTILASAYAVNPRKGSEDGMGWNFAGQIARHNKVIIITRKNNQPEIESFMEEHPEEYYSNLSFYYYDLPYYLRFWKRKNKGAMIYYLLWQLCMPIFIKSKKIKFDIAHNLNFHNDWTPSFLWTLGKPTVWGPVGHHPKIPRQHLLPVYGLKAYLKDRLTWWIKKYFWRIDPFLQLTKYNADHIWCMNKSVPKALNLKKNSHDIMPSVASEDVEFTPTEKSQFNVLSVGRFIPLKGFDVTISSFAYFYHQLTDKEKETKGVHLTLVGSGPQKAFLERMCKSLKIDHAVTFIDWIERSKLQKIYRNASVFLFPSHEGAGMVVSEALSYGLPVLSFDNAGPGEFVTKQCGMTVPYGDYEQNLNQFSANLHKLYADQNMLDTMSTQARRRFDLHFTWAVRGQALKNIYNQISSLKSRSGQTQVSAI